MDPTLYDAPTEGSRAYRAAKRLQKTKDAVEAQATVAVLRGVGEAGSGVVRGAKTVGTKIKVARLQRRADLDTGSLTDREKQNLQAYLAGGGEDAADELEDLSQRELRERLSVGTSTGVCLRASAATGSSAVLAAQSNPCSLSDAELKRLHRRLGSYQGSTKKVVNKIESLDPVDRKRVYVVIARADADQADDIMWGIDNVNDGSEAIAKIFRIRTSGSKKVPRPGVVMREIRYLRSNNVDIDEDVITRLSGNKGNIKGSTFELETAVAYQKRGYQVEAVGKQVSGFGSDADVLIKLSNGRKMVVETKNRRIPKKKKEIDEFKSDLGDQIYSIRSEYGQDTKLVVRFKDTSLVPFEVLQYVRQKDGVELKEGA